jgi:hypothetical protein
VSLQSVTGFRVGPKNRTGENASIEPVIPLPLGSEWNIIIQPRLAMEYLPSPDATTGLLDFQTSVFLTPERTGSWIWGVGPIVEMPTTTSSQLGSGKWSAGPTGAIIYSQGPWLNGVLASQLVSFAGAPRRAKVNLTSIELQASYTFGTLVRAEQSHDHVRLDRHRVDSADRSGRRQGAHRRGSTMTLQGGDYDLVERPEGAPAWIIRVAVTLLFPTEEQ